MSYLWKYAQKEGRADVFLVGNDGEEVPASRFMLASRCKYFDTVFYGPFGDEIAKDDRLKFEQFSSYELEALVKFCFSQLEDIEDYEDKLEKTDYRPVDEESARKLVHIYRCALFFSLDSLRAFVKYMVDELPYGKCENDKLPHLLCAVFDEATAVDEDGFEELRKDSLGLILEWTWPIPALLESWDGHRCGVEMLSAPALETILQAERFKEFNGLKLGLLKKWKGDSGGLLRHIDLSRVDEQFVEECSDFLPSSAIEDAREKRDGHKSVLVEFAPVEAVNGKFYYEEDSKCYIRDYLFRGEFKCFTIQPFKKKGWAITRPFEDDFEEKELYMATDQNAEDVPSGGWKEYQQELPPGVVRIESAAGEEEVLPLRCTVFPAGGALE